MKTKEYRSAAITGAGSGLDRDIALGLAAKGYQVFGTAMAVAEIADLREASAGKVNLSVCDPKNSGPWLMPNAPRANPNGMF